MLLLTALLAGVVVVAAVTERGAQRAEAARAPSTYSRDPKGLKALFEVLARFDFRLRRLDTDWRALASSDRLLVVAEPFRREVGAQERDALKQWIRGGGTLLYLTDGLTPPRNSPLEGVARRAVPP